jgi:hypothetical protein
MAVPLSTQLMPRHKLLQLGLKNADSIHYQCSVEELVAASLDKKQGELNDTGASGDRYRSVYRPLAQGQIHCAG